MIKLFEIVCTANFGRSPAGELIARRHLNGIEKDKEYGVISSGSHVIDINEGLIPIERKKQVIGWAQSRGLYGHGVTNNLINQALREDDDNLINDFYLRAADIFHHEEAAFRARSLGMAGYNPTKVKRVQEQTVARDDVVAILTMSGINFNRAIGIYERRMLPKTEVFDLGISNAYGHGEDRYRVAFAELEMRVPEAIDRFLAE
jgi:hypothetical protein